MAFFKFSLRIFERTASGVMPSTSGCCIPADRKKRLSTPEEYSKQVGKRHAYKPWPS